MSCAEVVCITHPIYPQQPIAKLTIMNCNRRAARTIISQAIKTASKRIKPVARLLICKTYKTNKPHGVRHEQIVSIHISDSDTGPGN
jgi:hypothetical protein